MYKFMGRPTNDPKTVVIQMRVSEAFVEMIDGWREDQKDAPSRAEAIRRLCEFAVLVKSKVKR